MSLRVRQFTVALLAVAAIAAGPARAADPFYTTLLRDGAAARARGDLDTAIEDLRIACFGLLDEPPLLAEGLVELALAQAEAGQSAELTRSVDRLLEIEERFGAYSQARHSADARRQFEELLYRRVDPARFEGLAVFAPLAERRELDALAAAGPDQRRLMLAERLTTDPTNVQWLRMAADLETSQGQPAAAVPHLSALLDQTPDDAYLRCERFRAAARAGRCDIALADVATCPTDAADAQLAEPILECHIARSGWQEASLYLDTLPANVRSTSRIRKLDRQVEKGLRSLPGVAETEPLPTDTAPPIDTAPPTPTAPPIDTAPPTGTEETVDSEAEPVADSPPPEVDPEPVAPPPDPCDPFRTAARARRCEAALAGMTSCLGAAAERDIAPAIMRCHADADAWTEALAFAELLPPQVRALSKIRKLERRATKRLASQTPPAAIESPDIADDATSDAIASDTDTLADSRPGESAAADTAAPTDVPLDSARAETTPPEPTSPPSAVATPPEAALADARRLLFSASTSADITRAYAVTSRLALDYPGHRESQFLAGQGAYRAAQWDKAVAFFDAAGGPGDDEPLLQFYCAVAFFETGRTREAADMLDRALPKIRRTPFVDSYVARIHAAAGRP